MHGSVHALDNPIWSALRTEQRALAEVHGVAARFPPAVTSLAGLARPTRESFEALAALLGADGVAGVFLDEVVPLPPDLEAVESAPLLQMVQAGAAADPAPGAEVELRATDVPAMMELARLTRPGPFGPRTIELGTFLGVFDRGQLVAMVGQRLRFDGFIEVSAVCTHPDHAGRGLGAHLNAVMAARIRAAGRVPFLHVRADNVRAIGLYARLGFAERRRMQYLVVRRPAAPG
jgi:ribosomal protein S18 acetylase RimI-like enzyme